jgi:hypothetical protein
MAIIDIDPFESKQRKASLRSLHILGIIAAP